MKIYSPRPKTLREMGFSFENGHGSYMGNEWSIELTQRIFLVYYPKWKEWHIDNMTIYPKRKYHIKTFIEIFKPIES